MNTITCGIDIGSRTTKLVLFDQVRRKIIYKDITDSKLDKDKVARGLFRQAVAFAKGRGLGIQKVIATGYGSHLIRFADKNVTEITCHARGVSHLMPTARTIIEIGGQDSKLINLGERGQVIDFAMNDRCAAGTGRFLEMVARLLDRDIRRLGVAKSRKPVHISSMCVVFAESEIIGLLARKISRNDIITGVQRALAGRIIALNGRDIHKPVVFTGGVALVAGMALALEWACGKMVLTPAHPQFTGALGAALIAAESE